MRSYCCDSMAEEDCKKLMRHLTELELQSSIPEVFWLPIPESFLTSLQKDHCKKCGPYHMALVIEETSVYLELLVRSSNALHCNCIAYAHDTLRNHMINWLESTLDNLPQTA